MPSVSLQGRRVAILGGDERETVLARALVAAGAGVAMVGFGPQWVPPGARLVAALSTALEGVDAVIAPMTGADGQGRLRTPLDEGRLEPLVLSEAVLALLPPGTPLLIGKARPLLRSSCRRLGLRLVELAEDDEIAILNAIPTAEGAIALAMAHLRATIHGSRAVVVGYGRCGQQIGRLLRALGAQVTAITPDRAERARAVSHDLLAGSMEELPEVVARADLVFNTAPAPVIGGAVLDRMPRWAVLIDIASEPGGTDFERARQLGLVAIHAPGLPGRMAPRTAGQILARVVPGMLAALWSETPGSAAPGSGA